MARVYKMRAAARYRDQSYPASATILAQGFFRIMLKFKLIPYS